MKDLKASASLPLIHESYVVAQEASGFVPQAMIPTQTFLTPFLLVVSQPFRQMLGDFLTGIPGKFEFK